MVQGQKAKIIDDNGCSFEQGQIVTFVGEHYTREDMFSFKGISQHSGEIVTQLLLIDQVEFI